MKTTIVSAITAMLALCVATPATHAVTTTIIEPFNTAGPDSTVPEGWTATNPDATKIVTSGGQSYLRIRRGANDAVTVGSSAIYYTGTSGEVIDGKMLDFDAELTLQIGGKVQSTSLRGVVVRAQSLSFTAPESNTFWGYSVGFIAEGDDRGLYIFQNPTGTSWNTAPQRGTQLDYIAFTEDLLLGQNYTLRISAQGTSLTASLWDDSTELASVAFNDAIMDAGYFGLRANHANSSADTLFQNLTLTVHAIPEAKTASLLLSALGLGAIPLWRRFSSRRAAGSLALTAILASTATSASHAEPVNIAKGCEVTIAPAPTRTGKAEAQRLAATLTDGNHLKKKDPWREDDALVWKYTGPIHFVVDLKEEKHIDEIAIHLLGGSAPWGGQGKSFPSEVQAYVSSDGEEYAEVGTFSYWNAADLKKFNIPEDRGEAWMHRLAFSGLSTRGRWVGLRVYGSGLTIADEITVHGKKPNKQKTPTTGRPAGFSITHPQLYFHKSSLQVATNVPLPIPVGVLTPNTSNSSGTALTFQLELPPGLELRGGSFGPASLQGLTGEKLDNGNTRYELKTENHTALSRQQKHFARLYLQASGWVDQQQGSLRYRFGNGKGWQSPEITLPVHAITLEPAPQLKELMLSLGWWYTRDLAHWPDALQSFRTIGLNTVPFTSRSNEHLTEQSPEILFLNEARAQGFMISCVDSPIQRMLKHHPNEKEIYCQHADGTIGNSFCPSYRGRFWDEEVERFATMIALVKPNFTSQDIEVWKAADRLDFDVREENERKCTRCTADFLASGITSPAAWKQAKGVELWQAMITAARKASRAVNGPEFRTSGYNFRPGQTYQEVWNFNKLYTAELLDHSQVSNYTALYPRHLESIGDWVRKDRSALPAGGSVFPWLTPGDVSPYPGEAFQWSMLEAFTNGAAGVWFWSHRLWDAETLIALNRVAHAIAPVEETLLHGDLVGQDAIVVGNGRISGVKREGNMVLLAANYGDTAAEEVTLQLRLPARSQVVDLISKKPLTTLPAGVQTLRVPLENARARLLSINPAPTGTAAVQ